LNRSAWEKGAVTLQTVVCDNGPDSGVRGRFKRHECLHGLVGLVG